MNIYKLVYLNQDGVYNCVFHFDRMTLESFATIHKILVWQIVSLYYNKDEDIFSQIGNIIKQSPCFNNFRTVDYDMTSGRTLPKVTEQFPSCPNPEDTDDLPYA